MTHANADRHTRRQVRFGRGPAAFRPPHGMVRTVYGILRAEEAEDS
ncbi:hypothetical protein [Limobrevibacterium gyesilva]|uniref:Uncharacterized protein n=1 Tax=Limobrevibacterium gyesilva TaxID=2991712 RepID=A0AA42CFW8_9PROT|nr:hypothetical protein [Limobrevibacterium gyesilva]MCW3477109.1 hypothetical protein [Limobrevibacterium gyesilva]